MARRKVKNSEKSPWGQCLTRPVPNGRRRSDFWLVPENFSVFLHQRIQWINFGQGFIGCFDALWSELISGHRSWSGTSRKNTALCGYIPRNSCTRLRRKKNRRKIHFFFISVLKNLFRRYFRLRTAVLRMYISCKLWRMRGRSVHFQ